MGRCKKKKTTIAGDHRQNPNGSSSSSSPLSADDHPVDLARPNSFRNWSDLPQHLLISILDRICYSIPDVLSFAAVSRHFLAAAVSSGGCRGPPLLLKPDVYLPDHHPTVRWSHPPRCRLRTLTNNSKLYSSPISSQTLTKFCIGYSNSHLIFVSSRRFALLADVFTGREIRSPNFPSGSLSFTSGILTAPLTSSSSCSLLLVARRNDGCSILCWRPASGGEWSVLDIENPAEIVSLVVFKGEVFALDALCRVIAVVCVPNMSWRLLHSPSMFGQFVHFHYGIFRQQFVECNGELLVVLFVPANRQFWLPGSTTIAVYKLELEKSMWVEKEDLGDWCLFIDAVGRCGFSCQEPTRWGGRKNCVYVAGPGCDGWSVIPLDGEAFDTTDVDAPLCARYMSFPRWPSAVWVYPSMRLL